MKVPSEFSQRNVQPDQFESLSKLVAQLQVRLKENEDKVKSFEQFLNISNPMGAPYVLKPGKSEITLPVNFTGLKNVEIPSWLSDMYRSLPAFNYNPLPFAELSKRSFKSLTKMANGDWYEGQWCAATGKRDGFGYCL